MYKPYDKLLDKIAYYSGLIILVGGIIALFFINKHNIDVTNLPAPCMLYTTTGLYCPGCGGTRSLVYLLHGHIFKSLYYHPFVAYVFFPWLWFLLTRTIHIISSHFFKPRKNDYAKFPLRLFRPISVRPLYLYIGIGLLLIQCLAKNIAYISGHPPF